MPRPPVRGRAGRPALPPPPPPPPPPLPEAYFEPEAALAPDAVATRRWMLVASGLGVLALVAAVVAVVTLSGESNPSTPEPAAVATQPSSAGERDATPAASSTVAVQQSTEEESARLVASLQAQLKAAEIVRSGLQEQLATAEGELRAANERLAAVEAELSGAIKERDRLQGDLATAEANLAAAHEERLGLLASLEEARTQLQQTEALAVARGDYASALETCLASYKEALSHAVHEDWGGVPISIQNAGASCSHPPAP